MKRVKSLIGVLLVLVAVGGIVGIAMDIYFKDKFVQGLTIQIVDEKGNPISANVIINELTENGPRELWSGYGVGIVTANLILPKKEVSTLEIGGKKIKVYRSINLEVVAYTKGLKAS